MTRKKIVFTSSTIIASIAMLVSLNSCKGDKGDPGPQGNANVASGSIAVTGGSGSNGWSWDATNSESYVDLTDNSITQDIVNTGAVMVFESSDGGNTWTALPFTTYSGSESYTTSFTYSVGAVIIWDGNSLLTQDPPLNNLTFKIVVVASDQRKAHTNINWNNYNEAMTAIGSQNIKESNVQLKQKVQTSAPANVDYQK